MKYVSETPVTFRIHLIIFRQFSRKDVRTFTDAAEDHQCNFDDILVSISIVVLPMVN